MIAQPIEREDALELMRADCAALFARNPFCPIAALIANALADLER